VYLIVCLLIDAVLKHVGERAGRVASLGQPVAAASNSTLQQLLQLFGDPRVIFGKQDSGSIHAPTVGDVSRRAQFGKLRGGLRKTPEVGASGAGATGGLESA